MRAGTPRKLPGRSWTTQTPRIPPRKPPGRSQTIQTPTAPPRKPPARSAPAEHAALLTSLRSVAVLSVPGFPERAGPFHSHPVGWLGQRTLVGWLGQRTLVGWTDQRTPAVGQISAPLSAGQISAPLSAGRADDSRQFDRFLRDKRSEAGDSWRLDGPSISSAGRADVLLRESATPSPADCAPGGAPSSRTPGAHPSRTPGALPSRALLARATARRKERIDRALSSRTDSPGRRSRRIGGRSSVESPYFTVSADLPPDERAWALGGKTTK